MFPANIWVILVALAVFGGRLLWVDLQRPSHWRDIADAYGSIIDLSHQAGFNHDFSRMTYVAHTDARGVGLFMCDTATGQKWTLDTEAYGSGEYGNNFNFTAWPWAPDDSAYI
jgi:hypothetical protein